MFVAHEWMFHRNFPIIISIIPTLPERESSASKSKLFNFIFCLFNYLEQQLKGRCKKWKCEIFPNTNHSFSEFTFFPSFFQGSFIKPSLNCVVYYYHHYIYFMFYVFLLWKHKYTDVLSICLSVNSLCNFQRQIPDIGGGTNPNQKFMLYYVICRSFHWTF